MLRALRTSLGKRVLAFGGFAQQDADEFLNSLFMSGSQVTGESALKSAFGGNLPR